MSEFKEQILNKLREINYPEFNRDIVSFGIVKNIMINDNQVIILLQLNTDNNKHKKEIKDKIYGVISDNFNFEDIIIDFSIAEKQITNNEKDNKIKNIIAVASCKGGVGKSTVSLNLACKLSEKYKVGLLDLDIYGPSLPTMIGNKNQPEFRDNKIIPIEKFNMKLMSFGFINNEDSPTIWRGPMVARMTQQFFDNVEWGELDYLILDLPPGTGDIQLTLVQKIALTGAIIVTTPQELSLVDVKKGSDMFKKVNVPLLGVVENMSEYCVKGKINNYSSDFSVSFDDNHKINIDDNGNFSLFIDIFKGKGGDIESSRLDVPLLGKIALDPAISATSDSGIPYILEFPDSPIANNFNSIASYIVK